MNYKLQTNSSGVPDYQYSNYIYLTTWPRLKPRADHVGFVVGKVTLGFFSGRWCSTVSHHSNNATYLFTYHPGLAQ